MELTYNKHAGLGRNEYVTGAIIIPRANGTEDIQVRLADRSVRDLDDDIGLRQIHDCMAEQLAAEMPHAESIEKTRRHQWFGAFVSGGIGVLTAMPQAQTLLGQIVEGTALYQLTGSIPIGAFATMFGLGILAGLNGKRIEQLGAYSEYKQLEEAGIFDAVRANKTAKQQLPQHLQELCESRGNDAFLLTNMYSKDEDGWRPRQFTRAVKTLNSTRNLGNRGLKVK